MENDPAEVPFTAPLGRPLRHAEAAALLNDHFREVAEEDYEFDLPEDMR